MMIYDIYNLVVFFLLGCAFSYLIIRYLRYGFFITLLLITVLGFLLYYNLQLSLFLKMLLYLILPSLLVALVCYVFFAKDESIVNIAEKYKVVLNTRGYTLILENIRRGISIIASAGSGKTESIVYNLSLIHISEPTRPY